MFLEAHNVLSSSNLLEVGQCLILPKLLHQSCLLGWTDWCSTLRPSNFSDFGHFYSQKWPFWAQKSNFLTIDASSRPWWVEHWLNKVEHCLTHSGGSVWALRTPKKCHRGAPEASKLAVFGPRMHILDRRHLYQTFLTPKKWQNHWNLMGARLNINQCNPTDKIDARVLAKSNIAQPPGDYCCWAHCGDERAVHQHCSEKGPYFRDRVPIGTFLTFWVPIGSLFIFQGPYFQCFG